MRKREKRREAIERNPRRPHLRLYVVREALGVLREIDAEEEEE